MTIDESGNEINHIEKVTVYPKDNNCTVVHSSIGKGREGHEFEINEITVLHNNESTLQAYHYIEIVGGGFEIKFSQYDNVWCKYKPKEKELVITVKTYKIECEDFY